MQKDHYSYGSGCGFLVANIHFGCLPFHAGDGTRFELSVAGAICVRIKWCYTWISIGSRQAHECWSESAEGSNKQAFTAYYVVHDSKGELICLL